jgi:PLP dependent protein
MIQTQLNSVRAQIPEQVTLIAVSKTKPVSDLQVAYDAGQRHFGENKVQEMVDKAAQLPPDIRWHLIGHLQTNKVKYMASFVHLIHGVDSLKLLQEIDKQAKKAGRIQDVLLQFYIAQEDTKFGLNLQEAKEILASIEFQQLKRIQVCGVMGMASNTSDEKQVAREFTELKKIFGTLQNKYFKDAPAFKEISMGMSGDYQLAIQTGSTMVRVGSKIFGGR